MEKTNRRVDMGRLKATLRETAQACKIAKLARRAGERAQSLWLNEVRANNVVVVWQDYQHKQRQVDALRANAASHAERMTNLCMLKAHLRGRSHLSPQTKIDSAVLQTRIELLLDEFEMS